MSGDRKINRRATIGLIAGTDRLDEIVAIGRAQGGRVTVQRRAVLAELVAGNQPLSAYQLLARLKRGDASATPARIYRCLDFLLRHGMVRRLETTKSYVAGGNSCNAFALRAGARSAGCPTPPRRVAGKIGINSGQDAGKPYVAAATVPLGQTAAAAVLGDQPWQVHPACSQPEPPLWCSAQGSPQ